MLYLPLLLWMAACGGPAGSPTSKGPVSQASVFYERNYHFCSDKEKDRFLLGYYGENLLDTLVYFYVICYDGDTLYQDRWPSSSFLEAKDDSLFAGYDSLNVDSILISRIHNRMENVIEGQSPPLPDDRMMNYVPDSGKVRIAWRGKSPFFYKVGSDLHRGIGWSPLTKRVVPL